ncbi:hypothetical protein CLF_101171 [Clonorchis sinensis]|uniref:Uncharacterized protein n=1 Tax=Clonorchis sinensis TaxID=79923 RepID=G7Y542_CLOSI|nr:hypothetical protein CLF_101171 [Clonorchis sinensis]
MVGVTSKLITYQQTQKVDDSFGFLRFGGFESSQNAPRNELKRAPVIKNKQRFTSLITSVDELKCAYKDSVRVYRTYKQESGQDIDQFVRKLKSLVKEYQFKSVFGFEYQDERVRDVIINGLASSSIREALLPQSELTLDQNTYAVVHCCFHLRFSGPHKYHLTIGKLMDPEIKKPIRTHFNAFVLIRYRIQLNNQSIPIKSLDCSRFIAWYRNFWVELVRYILPNTSEIAECVVSKAASWKHVAFICKTFKTQMLATRSAKMASYDIDLDRSTESQQSVSWKSVCVRVSGPKGELLDSRPHKVRTNRLANERLADPDFRRIYQNCVLESIPLTSPSDHSEKGTVQDNLVAPMTVLIFKPELCIAFTSVHQAVPLGVLKLSILMIDEVMRRKLDSHQNTAGQIVTGEIPVTLDHSDGISLAFEEKVMAMLDEASKATKYTCMRFAPTKLDDIVDMQTLARVDWCQQIRNKANRNIQHQKLLDCTRPYCVRRTIVCRRECCFSCSIQSGGNRAVDNP